MIPLPLKLGYLAFVAVLVPSYTLYYDLTNFLWFSNLALLLGLVAVWLEHRRLVSMLLVSVFLFELVWLTGFIIALLRGGDPLLGITGYMFNPEIPLFIRGLSLYHIPLPFLLLWLVWRLGYDPVAWRLWIPVGWGVLLLTWWLSAPEHNINWVYGPADDQELLPGWGWLLVLLPGAALLWWLNHRVVLVLLAWFGCRRGSR